MDASTLDGRDELWKEYCRLAARIAIQDELALNGIGGTRWWVSDADRARFAELARVLLRGGT